MIDAQVLAYLRSNQSRFVQELAELIRFPTVGGQRKHAGDMNKCAAWLAQHLQSIGLERVDVIPTPGHPIVYAEWLNKPGYPTVLVYGHYDVQPADPVREWKSPPFEPVVRGPNLYGRGASDDKGQLFTHIKALESYLQTTGELPVNVRCLFEGEEEIGSLHLSNLLAHHRQDFEADIALISDMPILAPDRPAITYALRGAISLELEVKGPERDLHSGLFGGAVHNPLQVLCEIIGHLHDANGRVAIPGFYDRVRTWNDAERDYMAQTGPTEDEFLRSARVAQGWGEANFTSYERATIRPSLSVNGIVGGYQERGPKAVIPAQAAAKLNFRLVPDQNPREIEQLFRRYVADIVPSTVRTTVHTQSTVQPALLDRDHPAMRAAAVAYHYGFGSRPVFLRSGGSIPVVNLLDETLGIPTVLMGFALPDDRMHGPNEKFYLPNFFKGIRTSICFLAELSSMLRPIQVVKDPAQTFAPQIQELYHDH